MRAVQSASKHRRHQSVLPREGGDRFEGAACALEIWPRRIAGQDVELHQRHRRNRVFDQGFDRIGQPAERIGPGVVEEAAQVGVAVLLFDMRCQIERRGQPAITESRLVGAKGGP